MIRRLALAVATMTLSAATAALAQTPAPPPPLQPEVSDVASLPPATPHRVWIADRFGGGALILNGDTGDLMATLWGASLSTFGAGPGQKTVYVADSIWSKGNRGTRQDLIEVYDGASLKLTNEIPLPGRAYMNPSPQTFAVSADGGRGYVYNMQPSSSVVVVDLARGRVLSTVETPGCALAFAWGATGFSSLCGDGSLATVTMTGAKPALERSASFFDAEHDPVFEESPTDPKSGQTLFVTFSGVVHPVALGPKPAFAQPWTLQEAAGLAPASTDEGALAWRPGGRAPMAFHVASGKLYVLMHAGEHWTQKKPGTELWIIDLATHKVIRRAELKDPVSAVAVSQDDHPVLYLSTEKGLSVRDAGTLDELRFVDDMTGHPIVPPL